MLTILFLKMLTAWLSSWSSGFNRSLRTSMQTRTFSPNFPDLHARAKPKSPSQEVGITAIFGRRGPMAAPVRLS